MKRLLMAACACVTLVSCNTTKITPHDQGYIAGQTSYVAYTYITADKPEVQDQAKEIWDKVNQIDTVDELATQLDEITGLIDKALQSDKLTPAERLALRQLADVILKRIDSSISKEALKHKEAVEFLVGVRDGVNSMIPVEAE